MEARLKKYLQVFRMSWQNTFVYRLSLLAWRLRSFIVLLSLYFFWLAVYGPDQEIAGYSKNVMLTYIIGTSLMRAFVFSSRSNQVAADIAQGSLNNYLLKPIKYFGWMSALDLGDKVSDLFFLSFELLIFFVLFKPPFLLQTNLTYLVLFFVFTFLSMFIYFYLSLLASMTAFWHPEHNGWPVRFLFTIVIDFLCGGMFPLDILPGILFQVFRLLPTTYFIFYPLQIFLGRVAFANIFASFLIMLFWIFVLNFVVKKLWEKGIKNYTGVGI
jgi:ABC-2 type transport system permease protein